MNKTMTKYSETGKEWYKNMQKRCWCWAEKWTGNYILRQKWSTYNISLYFNYTYSKVVINFICPASATHKDFF